MIKRTTALFFVLLANLLLLVTAVVPHHHHLDHVCISNSHCTSDEDSHDASIDDCKHEHNSESNHKYCILKHVIVIPSNRDEQDFSVLHQSNEGSPFGSFYAVLENFESKAVNSTCRLNSPVFIASFYERYVSASIGLRAPPLV
jgi:hypothetical protein